MKYRFALCDDVAEDAQYLLSVVKKWAVSANVLVEAEVFPSAEAFLFAYEENKRYHVLLLDIEMGRMSGLELAKVLRKENKDVEIIFVTGYSDYIAEGYDVEALHYLVKPVTEEKLIKTLGRLEDRLKQARRALTLDAHGETVFIPLGEIRYVEVRQNYVTIYANEAHMVKKTLSELEKELDEGFIRTGRSHIVSLSHIRKITKTEIHLADNSVIPLPRGMYEPLNRAFIRYF